MEDIMNASAARRMRFLSTCAAVIVAPGLLGSTPVTKEKVGFARSAKAASADFAVGLLPGGFGFPICHTPAAGSDARGLIRLAQTRTEVPPSEMKAATPAPEFANIDPPLWDGLGFITYKITTSNAAAQGYFDQGLRLTYAFNHGEAQRAFRKAQKLDPTCAMCFWGEALVLGPNINLPMQDDAV